VKVTTKAPIKVYYNAACPVCKAGIESQMEKMEACDVEWKNIHSNTQFVDELNSDLEQVRKRLHVIDEHGIPHIGFDAFLILWQHSPHEEWKAKLLGLPIIKSFGQFAYNLFAAGLYRWNRAKKHW